MIDPVALSQHFREQFQHDPEWFARAPGRVNLIGEHTDYNGGLMLPAAIECEAAVAARVTNSARIAIWSVNYTQLVDFETTQAAEPGSLRGWPRYVAAVIEQFLQRGISIPGMEIAMDGDVPRGSGLSSSASLEVCLATLFNAVSGAGLQPMEIALLGQAAEHSPLVGVKCGIMDQAASALCQRDHALLLDARTLETRSIAFPSDKAAILIIDTKKRRGLVDSEYNRRREECATALRAMNKLAEQSWQTLGDVPESIAMELLPQIDEMPRRRARHVITENARVRATAQALESGDVTALFPLLGASHASLRDDFEVSCAELDIAAAIAAQQPGCLGARMTGAGFGGCVVALFEPGSVNAASANITQAYEKETGTAPELLSTSPAQGAESRRIKDKG